MTSRIVLNGFTRLAAQACGAALDLLLPPRCLACERTIAEPGGLCAVCWADMPWLEAPRCARLGTPFSHDLGAGALSPRAIAEPPLFDRARAAALYKGPARDLVLTLKFGGRRETAGAMGRWMAFAGHELIEPGTLLVPVPLHRVRLWQRRFNQAALLADAVARQSGADAGLLVLERVRRTRQQVGLDARERQKNVRGAFRLRAGAEAQVAGRPVVLVDDVLTTGSTVTACARVLKAAGAAGVDVLTFAVADPVTGDR
ncbi:ComF family protein [Polymorphum gilvum]|uniref:Phosphoribosyl transferase domain protein n=1 Tax=Polymorphum gilvum (strain LMG 25793 / CGMCC 1.9160 / SL003B-26A1) TaxID=991905 RepID=F2J330_POLGS|nr:ComF family protein [Polymorphum gilvum]ADZ68899.1 Phosphoribosyl transferase domain protein [Polymorphum gilvum SL003B-26A1]